MTGDLIRFKKGRGLHPHGNHIVAVILAEWRSPKMRRQKPDMATVLTSESQVAVMPIGLLQHVTAVILP